MKLSVIISTKGDRSSLSHLIDSITAQKTTFTFELIIVGNEKCDSLSKLVEAKKNDSIRLFFTGKIGVNHARNLGIEKSKGEILYFLDDDCLLEDDQHLANLVREHDNQPKICGVGGGYLSSKNAKLIDRSYNQICNQWLEYSNYEKNYSTNLIGGNASYKKNLLSEKQRFNPEVRYGGAEIEFNIQSTENKQTLVYLPKLSITHKPRISLYGFLRKAFLQGKTSFVLDLRKKMISYKRFESQPTQAILPLSTKLLVIFYHFSFRQGYMWSRAEVYGLKPRSHILHCLLRYLWRSIHFLLPKKLVREFLLSYKAWWDLRFEQNFVAPHQDRKKYLKSPV